MTKIDEQRRQALEHSAEIKRILCATEYALKNKRPATLLVTSVARGEGKSFFSAVLAATAAQSGKYRVAALDLNWHRPALHRFFNLDPSRSATDICRCELSELMRSSGQASLDILTAPGDDDDRSVLNGQVVTMTARLIGQARNSYDFVVVDSAAIFPANEMTIDPVTLSGLVDGVVMVVLTAATPRQQVRKGQKIMEAAGANILGVISNQWRMSAP